MTRKPKLFYNEEELPLSIHYVSKTRGIDQEYDIDNIPGDFPCYFTQFYAALKKGTFDEIIVNVSPHCECYYSKHVGSHRGHSVYQKVPVSGNIKLSEFSNGGGYLDDRQLYMDSETQVLYMR